MKPQQASFYAACPILYWPWLWLQFWRLDHWMAERLSDGQRGCVMLHLGPRGTLTMSLISDSLNDDVSPKDAFAISAITFESLTFAYYPDWMYCVALCVSAPKSARKPHGARAFTRPSEISAALIPVP